jgi:hypothetical protein
MLKLAVAVLLLGTSTAYAVEDLPAGPSDCGTLWKQYGQQFNDAKQRILRATDPPDVLSACVAQDDEILIIGRFLEMLGRGCVILPDTMAGTDLEGKSLTEIAKMLLAERDRYLNLEETYCVGVIPQVPPVPSGFFNCHAVAMRVLGKDYLLNIEIQEAKRNNDKQAQCSLFKELVQVDNEETDLPNHPGCYFGNAVPGLIKNREHNLAAMSIVCGLTPAPTTNTPVPPATPIPPISNPPTPNSNQQFTIVLQRPSVPGGPWTLRQGNTVRQVADSSIGPEARALLGNDLTETLLGHVDPNGTFHVDRRVK